MHLQIEFRGLCLVVQDKNGVRVLMPSTRAHGGMHPHHSGDQSAQSNLGAPHQGSSHDALLVHTAKITHHKLQKGQELRDHELDLMSITTREDSKNTGEDPALDCLVDLGTAIPTKVKRRNWKKDEVPENVVENRILLPLPTRWHVEEEDLVKWRVDTPDGSTVKRTTHRVFWELDNVDNLPEVLTLRAVRDTGKPFTLPAPDKGDKVKICIANEPPSDSVKDFKCGDEATHFQMYFPLAEPDVTGSVRLFLAQDPPGPKLLSSFNCMMGKAPPG